METNAFTIISINDTGTVQTGEVHYDSATDAIRIEFAPQRVYSTIHAFNPPTGTVRNLSAPTGTWIVASGFTCVGTYDYTAKDANGNTVLTMTLVVEEGDLVSPACDSGNGEETSPPVEDCGTVVCECIEQLKSVLHGDLESISLSINQGNAINQQNGQKLDIVNNNLSDLKVIATDIKNEIISLHDEFETDVVYDVPSMKDTSNLLDENKPTQPTTKFTDNTIYFEDSGSAEIPGALPSTPEPKHWEGFLPQDAIPAESEKVKDGEYVEESELQSEPVNTIDAEMVKDNMSQDLEMVKDVQSQDLEIQQDLQMQQQTFTQDEQLQTQEIESTHDYQQTNFYEQTNVFP